MKVPRSKISAWSIEYTTDCMKALAESHIQGALEYLTDPRKKDRVKEVECKACFYMRSGRIGGASVTFRPCAVCGEDMGFGNTNTDILCKACGNKHKLCSYCGGDLEMRVRRKEPIPDIAPWKETDNDR